MVWTTTPSSKYAISALGCFLICLASIYAVLQDHHDTDVNRARLSLPFNISGKGKQPVRVRGAQRRAVRRVSAQPQSKSYTSSCGRLTRIDLNAPGIIPSVNLSAQAPGTVQDGLTSLGIFPGDSHENGNSALCLFWPF